jgi:hypothetical protein
MGGPRKEVPLLLPSNACVELDGRELSLAIVALAEKATGFYEAGKHFEGDQHLMLALKLKRIKRDFHEKYQKFFESKYGLDNSEKPAGGQTFQG